MLIHLGNLSKCMLDAQCSLLITNYSCSNSLISILLQQILVLYFSFVISFKPPSPPLSNDCLSFQAAAFSFWILNFKFCGNRWPLALSFFQFIFLLHVVPFTAETVLFYHKSIGPLRYYSTKANIHEKGKIPLGEGHIVLLSLDAIDFPSSIHLFHSVQFEQLLFLGSFFIINFVWCYFFIILIFRCIARCSMFDVVVLKYLGSTRT